MSWFWVNIPLAAVFFTAMVGIPLWIVIKHPDTRVAAEFREAQADARALTALAETAVWDHFPQTQPVVVAAPARRERVRTSRQAVSAVSARGSA